jgi:hypothetical protein
MAILITGRVILVDGGLTLGDVSSIYAGSA